MVEANQMGEEAHDGPPKVAKKRHRRDTRQGETHGGARPTGPGKT